eukprot:gene4908-8497_t
MDVAVVCTGIMGVLMWCLSLKVSLCRGAMAKEQSQESQRNFTNYNRAHGNTSENVPMLAVLFIGYRLLFPEMSMVIKATMILITFSRFLLAFGLIINSTKPTQPRFIGAVITLLGGAFLSATFILKGLGISLPY